MRKKLIILFVACMVCARSVNAQPTDYLTAIKSELKKSWPQNKTINIVFHGHSVPAGYFRTPEVRTLDAYPYLVLQGLKKAYPAAVINIIVTAIGGENSTQGLKRFRGQVLTHRPDVLFIDYALNDRKLGLQQSRKNIARMIRMAQRKGIRVILLTPSPDLQVDLLKPGNELELFAVQARELAGQYRIGLVDSYEKFKQLAKEKKNLQEYMAQSNHPNRSGHELIADEILRYFF